MSDINALIVEYSKNPSNKYRIDHPTIHHREENRSCADIIEVFICLENNTIVEWSFDGYMSIVATASASIFGESIIGKTVDEVLLLDEDYIKDFFGNDISPRRRNGSLMGLLATRNAFHLYQKDGIRDDFSDILSS